MTEEDVVEYKIWPSSATAAQLEALLHQCMALLCQDILSYLWHKDRFHLMVNEREQCLQGRVCYAENVEDEWFVVSLLLKLSSSNPDLVIQVTDEDGEFLLIESADHLPAWAQEPDLSANRVFIHQGQVHLIPRPEKPSELTPLPSSIPDPKLGADVVRKYSSVTVARTDVQNSITARLKSYPESWSNQRHFTRIIVPQSVATIFKSAPQLISAAVQNVSQMDPLDAKIVQRMNKFHQESPVLTGLTMTRCLYSMLTSQSLFPARKSGWKLRSKDEEGYKEELLGFKITCGLELLYSRMKTAKSEEVSQDSRSASLFAAFVKKLEGHGFFDGELPGSAKYVELESKARDFFNQQPIDEEMSSDAFYFQTLSNALDNNSSGDTDWSSIRVPPSDSEDWLEMDEKAFETLLQRHFGPTPFDSQNGQEVIGNIEKFLNRSSDMSGVETENQVDDDVNFNMDEFESIMCGASEEESEAFYQYLSSMEEQLQEMKVKEPDVQDDEKIFENLSRSARESATAPSNILLENL